MFRNYRFRNYNLRLIVAMLGITILGIMVIGSANAENQNRQIIGMTLGLGVMAVVSLIDYEFVLRFSWVYYFAAIGLLLLVFTPLGHSSGGATRWILLGESFTFQPSEMAKVLLVLFFAKFFMARQDAFAERSIRDLLFTAVLAAVPLFLIVREPDLSTTIVTFLIIFSMLFLSGLPYKFTGILIGVGGGFGAILLILLKNRNEVLIDFMGYHATRILAWLFPEEYPENAYQQLNSIMAVGSGQLYGKGLNNDALDSVKTGGYIAEPHTDFIFAVAGEELGFVGSVLIVILLLIIVFECIRVARSAKDKAGELICVGMAALISFQSFVNICVVTGLMPNTGLTLPFVSYGLTSLVTLYFGMGFVLNVGLQSRKSYELTRESFANELRDLAK